MPTGREPCGHQQGNIINITKEDLARHCHTEPETGCWIWTGAKTDKGYGRISRSRGSKRKNFRAHRVSYELNKEPIPKNAIVMHTCDVPACINPEHLQLGTHAENSADMVKKGRSARAEQHGLSKLTCKQVRRILHLYKPHCKVNGGRALAKRFSVNPSTISYIVSGRSFAYMAGVAS